MELIEATDSGAEQPAPRAATFREVPWRLSHAAVGVAPFLAVATVAKVASDSLIPRAVVWPVGLLSYAWMLAYPLWVARRHGWSPRGGIRGSRLAVEFILAGFTVLAMWVWLIVGSVIWVAAFGQPRASNNPIVGATLSSNPALLVVILVLACACAPVIEEVIFRGVLYNALRRRAPLAGAVVIQAILFGLMHVAYGPLHAVATGLIGIGIALIYQARKTLLTPILCHAMHNTATSAVVLLSLGWNADPPFMGITVESRDAGAVIVSVAPGSGAEAAGLREGDVLTAVNGFAVRDTLEVRAAIHGMKPGETVAVEYLRGGESHRTEVVLGRRAHPM